MWRATNLERLTKGRGKKAAGGTRHSPLTTRHSRIIGFTLLELMIVMTLILILATMAVPAYLQSIQRAKEAVLRDDLYTMRKLIDQFTIDKNRPPQTLDELVEEHYLRGGIPMDPITKSSDTWQTVTEDVPINPQQSIPGVVDVHSGSEELSLDGTPYSSW